MQIGCRAVFVFINVLFILIPCVIVGEKSFVKFELNFFLIHVFGLLGGEKFKQLHLDFAESLLYVKLGA